MRSPNEFTGNLEPRFQDAGLELLRDVGLWALEPALDTVPDTLTAPPAAPELNGHTTYETDPYYDDECPIFTPEQLAAMRLRISANEAESGRAEGEQRLQAQVAELEQQGIPAQIVRPEGFLPYVARVNPLGPFKD